MPTVLDLPLLVHVVPESCVLDCAYNFESETFYVFDIIAWQGNACRTFLLVTVAALSHLIS